MRDEYVRLIIEYINGKPDYKDILHEIKADVLTRGATEQEFEEAVQRLAIPSTVLQTIAEEEIKRQLDVEKLKAEQQENVILKQALEKEKKKGKDTTRNARGSFVSPLIGLDIITHVLVAGFVIVFGVLFFTTPVLTGPLTALQNSFKPRAAATVAQTSLPNAQQTDSLSAAIAPGVYANGQAVDPNRVFSFPKSDVTLKVSGAPKKEIFGFFPYWMLEKANDISLTAVSTIALFGLEFDGGGNIVTAYPDGTADGGWSMWNDPKLQTFINKVQKKRIKVQITLKIFNNTSIEQLVQSDDAQKTFIANALHLMNSKNLNGINLDFEYVGEPPKETIDGFSRLVTNLREEMKRQLPNASLTVCTYVTAATNQTLFDVVAVAENSDAMVIMGYDIHTPLGSAGPIAPMFGGGYNIIGLMQSYLEKVSPDKLILAVPYYGYDWPVINGREATKTIDRASILSYAELANITSKSRVQWNESSQTPWYTYIDPVNNITHEVHYENTRSLGIKYDFVNKKNLKGVGIWALGYDGYNTDLQQVLIDKFAN